MKKNKKHKILVIEDDKFILKAMKYKFEEAKFDTKISTTGEGGLELLKNWKPDAIILDILLPGIDGYGFLRAVKKNPDLKEIPIIISSNLDEEIGADPRAAEYIVKSNLDLDDLVLRVMSHIQ